METFVEKLARLEGMMQHCLREAKAAPTKFLRDKYINDFICTVKQSKTFDKTGAATVAPFNTSTNDGLEEKRIRNLPAYRNTLLQRLQIRILLVFIAEKQRNAARYAEPI